MLKNFRDHIIENFAEKAASRKLKAVKAMFAEAHAEGYSLTTPANRLEVAVKRKIRAKSRRNDHSL